MSVAGSATTDGDGAAAALTAQAELLRAAQTLGRSPALERLLDFLLDCAREGRSPKEIEIAARVFARGTDAGDQDASVRVYVHRLRRKLDDFYAGAGAGEVVRIAIPKGGYRLTLEPHGEVPDEPPEPMPRQRRITRRRLLEVVAVLALMLVTALATWQVARRSDPVDAPIRAVRATPLWTPVVSDGRRTVIVVGDFYIFGEADANGDVTRLVREFDVNSPADLARLTASRPDRAGSYVDLGLGYLPVGVASALRVVVPIVRRNDVELLKPLVVPASQLTPDMVKNANLVYLGYISGLGSLRDPVFSGSRFTVGGSYDEIVDRTTGRHYMAATHLDANGAQPSEDYALISSFPGPTGNRVVVIAGTRDAALMQAAEFATRSETATRLGSPSAFEALLAVETLHDVGLRARLVTSSARPREADWSGRRAQAFPDDMRPAAAR